MGSCELFALERGEEALIEVEWPLVLVLKLGKELFLPWWLNPVGTQLKQVFVFSKSVNRIKASAHHRSAFL